MNKLDLNQFLNTLNEVVEELESAIYSDVDSYKSLNVDYQDVLDYYNDTANAEEGL